MSTVLDLRQLLLASADELGLQLTEREVTTLADRAILKAASLRNVAGRPLSRRKMEVLLALAVGEPLEETGARLFVTQNTLKTHRRLLYRQLGAKSGAHAVALGIAKGLLTAKVGKR